MKILITGGNGYVAKSLFNVLKNYYDITTINRKDFDLTNTVDTLKYFSDKQFDVVLHCAVTGGSRLRSDTIQDLDNNLSMYYNLLSCNNSFKKLINFSSGAEVTSPESLYGLSKRVISKSIIEKDNFYNIMIFAVFDENELDTRFIKANIKRYINKESIVIHQDKVMDFFYMKDLISLVNYYIVNDNLPKQLDCSYSNLYTLSEIANMINNLDDYKVDINIENKNIAPPYRGLSNTLIDFIGLRDGIKEVYTKLKNKKNEY